MGSDKAIAFNSGLVITFNILQCPCWKRILIEHISLQIEMLSMNNLCTPMVTGTLKLIPWEMILCDTLEFTTSLKRLFIFSWKGSLGQFQCLSKYSFLSIPLYILSVANGYAVHNVWTECVCTSPVSILLKMIRSYQCANHDKR